MIIEIIQSMIHENHAISTHDNVGVSGSYSHWIHKPRIIDKISKLTWKEVKRNQIHKDPCRKEIKYSRITIYLPVENIFKYSRFIIFSYPKEIKYSKIILQCSPLITQLVITQILILHGHIQAPIFTMEFYKGNIGNDHEMSFYGILQRNYRKMTIKWSFSYHSCVKLSLYNMICLEHHSFLWNPNILL